MFLLFIYNSDFYYHNYELLDSLDTLIVILFIIHFSVNIKYYIGKNIIFVLYIVSFLQLFLIKNFLSDELYFLSYVLILITTLCLSFKNTKNARKHT